MNNENKSLSGNKKRRDRREENLSKELNIFLNKIKTEKKKKNRNDDKNKQSEIELVKRKFAHNPDKIQNALKELNKVRVVNKTLHEKKNEIALITRL